MYIIQINLEIMYYLIYNRSISMVVYITYDVFVYYNLLIRAIICFRAVHKKKVIIINNKRGKP